MSCVSKSDENILAILERRTWKNVWSGKKYNGVCRIRCGQDLMDLYREPYIISEIREGRLRWFGHVERMPQERIVKEVFKTVPEGKSFVGKSRKRWLYDDEKMGVRSWRKIYRDRDAWKLILKETRVLHGPCIQWRRGEVRQKMGTRTVDNRTHGRTLSERSHVGFTQCIVLGSSHGLLYELLPENHCFTFGVLGHVLYDGNVPLYCIRDVNV